MRCWQLIGDCSLARHVTVETALGDILLPDSPAPDLEPDLDGPIQEVTNNGLEYFKVKSPDMLGTAQWTVQRNKRSVKV